MGAVLRLYLGWRLFRLFRPVLGTGLIVAAALALHVGRAPMSGSARAAVQGGAAAAARNLPRALEHAFEPGPARP